MTAPGACDTCGTTWDADEILPCPVCADAETLSQSKQIATCPACGVSWQADDERLPCPECGPAPERKRVNPRARPRALAGTPVTAEQFDALTHKLELALPPNWFRKPICDLLAEAYMLGVRDAKALADTDGVAS